MSAKPDRDKAEGSDDGKPEPTPWEKFVETTRRVLSVPKAELDKREKVWRERRKRRGSS